jgi:hypothetical protein
MSTLKGLIIIVTMLVGGSSSATTLNGPATVSQPRVTSVAAGNSASLQHFAMKTGGIRSGSASNKGAIKHDSKGYKSGQ